MIWLYGRAGALVDALRGSPAARAAFAQTGTGLAACQQSAQLLCLQRHRPEALARAAVALHCKDWLFLRHGPLGGLLHLRRLAGPRLPLRGAGGARLDRRRAAAAAGDGRHPRKPPLVAGRGRAHRAPRRDAGGARPCRRRVRRARRRRLRRGRGRRFAARQHGDAPAPRGERRRGGTVRGHDRLLHAPSGAGPRAAGAVQHGRDLEPGLGSGPRLPSGAARWRPERRPGHMLAALDAAVPFARPGAVVYHPFVSAAGERGPFTDPHARATVLGLGRDVGLADLVHGIYEGLGFAARDCYLAAGGLPAEVRVAGGALRRGADDPRRLPRPPGARGGAAGIRRGGGGNDRRRQPRRLVPGHGGLRAGLGGHRCSAPPSRPTGRWRRSTPA